MENVIMKKGLAFLLAFVMVLTMQGVAVSAASFADTQGEPCETAANVLYALGIVEGKAEGAYQPNGFLTRAEMATILLRAMNMAENAMGQDVFTDVPSSHWAYANIAA
ncbi:MAG: S-layer homology domain-containing protein, partial [Ruminococcaceae bacterium]|nr:S-layer homology domain-containing protein [Oscillospiraceae bacterium]